MRNYPPNAPPTPNLNLLFFGGPKSRKETFLRWHLIGELVEGDGGINKSETFRLIFHANCGQITFLIQFLDYQKVSSSSTRLSELKQQKFDGIFYFVENESFSPRLLQETTDGIDYLRNHFNICTPLQLILFRHREVSDFDPFPSPSPVHFHELAKQKKDSFLTIFDVHKPSQSEDCLLQMARTLCVYPDLCFVESPALAPAEVVLDAELMRQYEAELEQAKTTPIPDEEDFDDWSLPSSSSAATTSSSILFGASSSVNLGGSAFQLNGYSFGEERNEEAGFGLWSHPSVPLGSGFNSGGLRFPLQETKVEAQVLDAVSQVTVQQVFENKQNSVVENVTFSFPMDAMGAVCGFEAIIGNRRVRGRVEEKQEARRIYSEAIQQNKVALKLEEEKPDVFTTSLGNIPPGTKVFIKIDYVTELQMEGEDALRFVLPRRIAPRYTSVFSSDPPSETIPPTFEPKLDVSLLKLSIELHLSLSVNIHALHSIGYPSTITYYDNPPNTPSATRSKALVTFSSATSPQILESHQDFTLLIYVDPQPCPTLWIEKHQTSSETASWAGVITYFPTFRPPTPDSTFYFASSSDSSFGTRTRIGPVTPKREFVFLVDCSGSMSGVSITQARSALQAFLELLPTKEEEGVYFNIIKFGSNHSSLFLTSAPCSKENIDIAEKYIQALDANMGGTELLAPLQFILNPETSNFGHFSFPSSTSSSYSRHSHPRQVFVLTDGEITNTDAVFRCIRQHRGTTRVFSFGIGPNPSRHLVLGMARAGDGKAEFVIPGEQLTVKVLRQMEQSLQPSLTNLSVDWLPERRDCLFVQAPSRLGTLYPKSRLIVYTLFDSCPNGLENARVTLNFDNQPIVLPILVKYQESSSGTIPLIHTLTARSIIREMEEKCSQFHDDNGVILAKCLQYPLDTPDSFVKRQIVALGQAYNLASSKTSFVAVVEE